MSKFKQKAKAIYQGWKNVRTGLVNDEHNRRAEVCNGCEHRTESNFLTWIHDNTGGKEKLAKAHGAYCSYCDCALKEKIMQDVEPCPKWSGNELD